MFLNRVFLQERFNRYLWFLASLEIVIHFLVRINTFEMSVYISWVYYFYKFLIAEQEFRVHCLQKGTPWLGCLVPRRLSLDENVRAKEGGKETTGETCFACHLYPSHGPLRFITSHSRFALASTMRKTKRLRRTLGLRCSRLLTHSIEADQLICYSLKGIFLFRSGWQETPLVRERPGETGNNSCGWPVTSAFDIK